MGASGREGRSIVEDEFRLVGVFSYGTLKGILSLPSIDDAVLKGREVRSGLNLTEGVLLAHGDPVPIDGDL
jgi:hypothetical protein